MSYRMYFNNMNTGSIMSRPPKPIPQAKKVAPPAVPEMYRYSTSSSNSTTGQHNYTSDDGGFLSGTPSTVATSSIRSDDNLKCNNNNNNNNNNKNNNNNNNNNNMKMDTITPRLSRHLVEPLSPSAMTLSGQQIAAYQRRDTITHKAAVYYHQQYGLQEDQGIDLTQSPGRDSPGSSSGSAGSGSRHSTVSLDSGRSSSYLTGSVDRMNQRTDHDIILDWLMVLNSDDYIPYAQLFSMAGYDLATISRMTPEDLTAIGITNPHHREIIKQHIDALQLPDSLPNYVPGSIDEWLRLLRLDEYVMPLLNQGYQSVRDATQLTWEDLEEIGIIKLGHQKKILLAIKRVKDIISGKVVPCVNSGQSMMNMQPITVAIATGYPTKNLHEDQFLMPSKAIYFDPRHFQQDSHHLSYNQSHYQHPLAHSLNWRRSYDDGDITPTNEIMDAKVENASGGGTLPRQQRQTKRPITTVIGNVTLPPPQPLLNTDYSTEASKQMSMYYSTPATTQQSPSDRRISNNIDENVCQKVEKCFIDAQTVHYGWKLSQPQAQQQIHPSYHQMMYNHQMMGGHQASTAYKLYAGQTHQTQAEVHVEHSQIETTSSIDSIDNIPFANENAGTIKQRLSNRHELPQSTSLSSTSSSSASSTSTAIPLCSSSCSGGRITSPANTECDTNLDDPDDSDTVFNDINIMLNKLNGEIDIMIEHGGGTPEDK